MIVRYHALADREVISAADYYSRQRSSLGAEFLDELNESVAQIAANP